MGLNMISIVVIKMNENVEHVVKTELTVLEMALRRNVDDLKRLEDQLDGARIRNKKLVKSIKDLKEFLKDEPFVEITINQDDFDDIEHCECCSEEGCD